MVERIRTLLESRELTPTQFADAIGVARPIISHILSGRNKPSLEVVQRILAAMPDLAMPWLLNGTGPMLTTPEATKETEAAAAEAHSRITGSAGPPAVPTPEAPATPAPPPPAAGASVTIPPATAPGAGHTAGSAIPAEVPKRSATPLASAAGAPKRFTTTAAKAVPPPMVGGESASPAPQVTPEASVAATAAAPSPSLAMPAQAPAAEVPVPTAPDAALASALLSGGDKPIRRIVIFYRDGSFADYQPE